MQAKILCLAFKALPHMVLNNLSRLISYNCPTWICYSSQMGPLITARMSLITGLSAPVISVIWVDLFIVLCLLLKVMSHITHKVIPSPTGYLCVLWDKPGSYPHNALSIMLSLWQMGSASTKSCSFLLSLRSCSLPGGSIVSFVNGHPHLQVTSSPGFPTVPRQVWIQWGSSLPRLPSSFRWKSTKHTRTFTHTHTHTPKSDSNELLSQSPKNIVSLRTMWRT